MASEIMNAGATARRMASSSVAFLKGIPGRGAPASFEPSNTLGSVEAPIAAAPVIIPSIIAKEAEISGSIATLNELHIHGTIEGNVRAARISICAGGTVRGDVTAESVIVNGVVEGRIYGGDVFIRAGAVVHGEITHRTLGIDTAAVFEGSIKRVAAAPADTVTT